MLVFDYVLGLYVVVFGVVFLLLVMGVCFVDGVFVGEYGSWNCNLLVGYKVVFVLFCEGCLVGDLIDVVIGFYGDDGLICGCFVGVILDLCGVLIVVDDLVNMIWWIILDVIVVVLVVLFVFVVFVVIL